MKVLVQHWRWRYKCSLAWISKHPHWMDHIKLLHLLRHGIKFMICAHTKAYLLMYCFQASDPDSLPPPVAFSPPNAPPISATEYWNAGNATKYWMKEMQQNTGWRKCKRRRTNLPPRWVYSHSRCHSRNPWDPATGMIIEFICGFMWKRHFCANNCVGVFLKFKKSQARFSRPSFQRGSM